MMWWIEMLATLSILLIASIESIGVELKPFGDNENILVATKSFTKGDLLVSVPQSMCLVVHRDGSVMSGLQGQLDASFDEVGDLRVPLNDDQIQQGRTWDVNLALALLDATAGTSLAESGEFYDAYAQALVPPERLTLPLCMNSEWMLDQIQTPHIKAAALAQQQRLASISALFSDATSHRITSAAVLRAMTSTSMGTPPKPVSPLQWAFSLVRSRCFKIDSDTFAFVPMIDMANHDFNPSVQFESSAISTTDHQIVCSLRALRDVAQGEDVSICYDSTYDSDRLFVQYGFTLDCNPNDKIPWSVSRPQLLHDTTWVSQHAKRSAHQQLRRAAESLHDGDSRSRVVVESLQSRLDDIQVAIDIQQSVDEQIIAILRALLADIEHLHATFPTSLSADDQLLSRLSGLEPAALFVPRDELDAWIQDTVVSDLAEPTFRSNATGGPLENIHQLRACLRYRMEKKRLLVAAEQIVKHCLNEFINLSAVSSYRRQCYDE